MSNDDAQCGQARTGLLITLRYNSTLYGTCLPDQTDNVSDCGYFGIKLCYSHKDEQINRRTAEWALDYNREGTEIDENR